MSRNITGTLLNPDGSNAAGAFLLTAKYNTPGTSGVPKKATQTITVTAGAYTDAVELGTYRVTWTPTAGEAVNLGVAVIPDGPDIDLLTLIAASVFPDGTDVNFDSLTTAALTVTGGATFNGATITDLGTVSAATSITTSALVATTADINGGTIDGATIGGATPATGIFTTLTANDQLTVNAGVAVTGDTADEITCNITGVAAQTAALFNVETSAGTDKLTVSAAGQTTLADAVLTTADINGGTIDAATIGGATPAAGTFTGLTASGTVSFSGATVSDLGTVSAATSITTAALTATGSFTSPGIDDNANATAITIDVSENVGIGIASPNTKVHVVNAALNLSTITPAQAKTLGVFVESTGNSNVVGEIYSGMAFAEGYAGIYGYDDGGSGANGLGIFTGNVVSIIRAVSIDSSGNVGIGTSSPNEKLSIKAPNDISPVNAVLGLKPSTGEVTQGGIGVQSGGTIGLIANNNLRLYTNSVERARVDSAGNLGLGVIPKVWQATYDALQIGGGGSVFAFSAAGAGGNIQVGHNFYRDAGGTERYIATDEATKYWQTSGEHRFLVSGIGSAGAAVTGNWITALTLLVDGGVSAPNIKTGITQVAAGAAAGEIWSDSDDDNTLKLGV